MDRSRVAPELRYLAWGNPLWLLEHGWGRRLVRGLTLLLPPLPIRGASIEVIKGAPGLRIYRPKTRRTDAALLWIHGGGYVIGSARTSDFRCGDSCRELGMTVVAVGQRLSPEHPFPLPSGVAVTFETVRAAPHGFEEIARRSKIARAYLARARDWLRDACN